MIYSLNVDTGVTDPGFPIDVNATFPDFSSSLQMQRGALMLLGNMVYVPYGGGRLRIPALSNVTHLRKAEPCSLLYKRVPSGETLNL